MFRGQGWSTRRSAACADSRCSTAGAGCTLASNQDPPGAIAVDAQSVYWVNGTGTVNKVAK
jgi:hypothetical protein